MDQQLIDLIDRLSDSEGRTEIDVNAEGTVAEITVGSGESAVKYLLKPLGDLYGKGLGRDTVDPEDETYAPLFLAIESEFVRRDRATRFRMTDSNLSLALPSLAMNPEANVEANPLALRIQQSLRMALSLNDYSRQEVRQALRKILKSVERHTKAAGQRGYLDFIQQYIKV